MRSAHHAGWRTLSLQAAGLLALLIVEGQVSRVWVQALLWPDKPDHLAQGSLRALLLKLRVLAGCKLFEPGPVIRLSETIGHDLDETDEALLAAVPGGSEALAPEAELLRDLDATSLEAFQDWLDDARREDRHRRTQRRLNLALASERVGRSDCACTLALAAVTLDPDHDSTLAAAMGILARAGRRGQALDFLARLRPPAELAAARGTVRADLRRLALAIEMGQAPEPPLAARQPPRLPAAKEARPLIGRASDLAAIEQAWQHERVLWLWGEPGVGKTALLQALVAEAPGRLRVTALLGDSQEPLACLARLLRVLLPLDCRHPADPDRHELARVVPELGDEPPGRPLMPVMIRAVQALCAHVRQQGVQAIVLDDWQWADSATSEMLAPTMALDSGPRWLAARHPAADGALPASGRLLRLAPLLPDQLALWLQQRGAAPEFVAAWADWLYRATGGSPRHVTELLRSLEEHKPEALGAPPSADAPEPARGLAELLMSRLDILPAPSLDLLRLTALAGPLMDPALAESVLGLPALAYARQCEALARGGLMHDGALAHDGLRQPLLQALPAPVASHLHRAIAQHAGALGEAPARVARHWRLAQAWPEAAAAYAAAAEQAQRLNRPTDALRLWDQAAHAWAQAFDPLRRFKAAVEAMELAMAVEPQGSADHRAQALLRMANTPEQRCEAHLALARCALTVYRWTDGQAEAQQAEACARTDPAAAPSALLLKACSLQMYALAGQGRVPEALALDAQIMPMIGPTTPQRDRMDHFGVRGNVLVLARRMREADRALSEALALAEALDDGVEAMVLANNLSTVRIQIGATLPAHEASATALRWTTKLDAASSIAGQAAMLAHGITCMRLGRLCEALALFDTLAQQVRQQPLGYMALHLAPARLQLWLELGQAQQAQAEWAAAMALDGADRVALLAVRSLEIRRQQRGQPRAPLGEDAEAMLSRYDQGRLPAIMALEWALMPERDPAAALTRAQTLAAQARSAELPVAEQTMHLAQAEALLRLGRPREASGLCASVTDRLERCPPVAMSTAAVWHLAWQCHGAANETALAQHALIQGYRVLTGTNERHVPEAYRLSYLQSQPLHAELIQAWDGSARR